MRSDGPWDDDDSDVFGLPVHRLGLRRVNKLAFDLCFPVFSEEEPDLNNELEISVSKRLYPLLCFKTVFVKDCVNQNYTHATFDHAYLDNRVKSFAV